ncbi:hypothetical protein EUTSA_v10000326mg [Eutrema salsugineum]|uniref:Protein RER1 n=1 Tax=Eutrema salsugineum TaxID=72664 RepID=V4LUU6_EUTSA|nr:hypothetical protein EUTSA_v10000326mg [Eutrema salsugineum]
MEPETTGGVSAAAAATDDVQSNGSSSPADAVSRLIHAVEQRQQHLLDKTVPHVLYRWIACLCVVLIYFVRVFLVEGFYIITYAIGIYLLNLIIAFLSPQEDPESSLTGGTLPTRRSDEYRPFVRRLPEFKFWLSIIRAFAIGFTMTFFDVFDVPCFLANTSFLLGDAFYPHNEETDTTYDQIQICPFLFRETEIWKETCSNREQ